MDRRDPNRTRLRAAVLLAGLAAATAAWAAPTARASAKHNGDAAAALPDDADAQDNDTAADAQRADGEASTLRQMFALGEVDGNLRTLYYANHNAFFLDSVAGDHDRHTASIGGKLGFTTAELHGISIRLSTYAQRNFARSSDSNDLDETGYNRDLGRDIATLGEAYLQYDDHELRLRAGNQALSDVPFTATYDYRIIPQLYQGVSARYGGPDRYLSAMRIYRYKSRIADSYDRTTNYNADAFEAAPPNTRSETDGFWAVGGADKATFGASQLSGKAWFVNYLDYADMTYVEGKIADGNGTIRPFFGAQFIRETDDGRALLGRIDHHTYGAQLGIERRSLTATLNYDYIPRERDSVLNGALVTPYAHNEASGPLFAQPYLTSTQDLGAGNAYAAAIKGAPSEHTLLGARYSYMDLIPESGGESIGQSEYLVYAIYNLSGAFEGLSVSDFFAYQTQKTQDRDFWENRLAIEYAF
ncbi:OprD family outer membrane porin [Salinisphaera sp. T31B1]|uniref:OprD family outer membrane porin n=1 Tax=Salinisphaera sp. T31B1 TaxID=727963 RepID=UPI003341C4FE